MNDNTLNALKWIAGILNENNMPYRVGGGMATFLYGSGRKINDIDISFSGENFSRLMPLVEGYVVVEPKHYLDEKWDCITLSLAYNGQDIDLTDIDTLLMKSSDGSVWLKNKEIYQKWPDVRKEIEGVPVTLMHPKVLLEYKQHLGGEHQEFDRKFLKDLIESGQY
ncbi:MAG: hypothetical protein NUW00_00110 [Candidatus Kaiserbacteria bacterium]|nr:hypothetical protein [Candidatus Kaiserbacteria bacterium]